MKLLLDTSAFIWVAWYPERLSNAARTLYMDENNDRYLSHASIWEMTIKYQLGKMPFKSTPQAWVAGVCSKNTIDFLPLSINDIYTLPSLPPIHKDPFDRILVAQAIANDMTLLTNDHHITQYNAKTLW